MRRRTLLSLAVAALLVTSGCAGLKSFGDGDQQSPPADVDVVERYQSLQTLKATQHSTIDYNGTTNETTVEVRIDFTTTPPRQFQRTVAPPRDEGDVTLSNESGTIIYDASENSVTRIPSRDTQALNAQNRSSYIARIVAAAREDGVAEPREGVSPLPVVPATSTAAEIPEGAIEGYDVEYLGTAAVAGRTAHGFRMTAASEAALAVNQTLWLDDEYFYPLKTHRTVQFDNRSITVTSELTDVTFNDDLPEDTFEFDVPDDATVETLNVSRETFDSVSALRAAADFSVPDPDVPEGYEFERGTLMTDNATRATLQYSDGTGSLLVTKLDDVRNQSTGIDAGENVTVAGNDGRYLTTGRSKLLTWSCGDAQYSVLATGIEKAELLRVAEGVACE